LRIGHKALGTVVCALAISPCFGESLYKQPAGPYQVNSVAAVTLNDPERSVDVTFRSWFPEGDGPFPVVVFSTGGFCASQMYERILHHWVSHGYVLIAPDHVDSPNRPARPTPEQMQSIIQTRVRDLSFTVDALTAIRREAGFAAKLNTGKLAVAGHSFGSGVAMMKSGLLIREQDRSTWGPAHDPRFSAAIALSPPGINDELATDAFSGLNGPFLATGGTNDLSRMDFSPLTPAEWRRQAFTMSPPGDKYSLIIDGADHYLGGLICNPERGGDPDPQAVEIVRTVTLAFLDAYLKDSQSGMDYLLTGDIRGQSGGRVDFRRR
jgi:predicted dienelactone hydrolase